MPVPRSVRAPPLRVARCGHRASDAERRGYEARNLRFVTGFDRLGQSKKMTERERKTAYAWDHIKQAGSAFAKRGDALLPGYRELKKMGAVTISGAHVQLAGNYRRAFLAGEDLPSWSDLSVAASTRHHATKKKSAAQLQREIDEALANKSVPTSWNIGDKVKYRGRPYIIVREAKPLEFWVKVRDKEPTHGVVTERAYDLIAGDDPDSFEAEFVPRIQASDLRVR